MGLKPSQYRSAAEALLRRFRKEDSLPSLHPAVDVCNAISVAFALPVAILDISKIDSFVEVCRAKGDEVYLSFNGEIEHPYPGRGDLSGCSQPRPRPALDLPPEPALHGGPGDGTGPGGERSPAPEGLRRHPGLAGSPVPRADRPWSHRSLRDGPYGGGAQAGVLKPRLHRSELGTPSPNLDLWTTSAD